MRDQQNLVISEAAVRSLLSAGNIAQADIFCQIGIRKQPRNPYYHYFMGVIAMTVNRVDFARRSFEQAATLAPHWGLPRSALTAIKRVSESCLNTGNDGSRYLLIKAWGYGFWSDVDHVLGQLLVAEMTNRIPVVHWGSNSLYGDGSSSDHFTHYFRPVSTTTIGDLLVDGMDYFPVKWNRRNLTSENINKFAGHDSRMAALYAYSRQEQVIVSDFYTRILNILPWLPRDHPDYGKTVDDVYRRLVRKYLHPRERYNRFVDDFIRDRIGSHDFLSVHMRGTDKIREVRQLEEFNRQYFGIIDAQRTARDLSQVFLMTDDRELLSEFRKRYDDAIIVTDCARSEGVTGLHKTAGMDGYRLGEEVLLDTLIAARGAVFIGHGFSNPSAMIGHLKDWGSNDIFLLGPNIHHQPNVVLHNVAAESLDPARISQVWSPGP